MSKPHCICFISAKGGSGKTVLSASLSHIIAELKHPVTIADCDAATNGLTLLHLPQLNRAKESVADGPLLGMFDHNGEGGTPSSITIAPGLSLVPATYTMASTEKVLVKQFAEMLDSLLLSLTTSSGDPGYLILDAQAGTDSFAYAAVDRADDVIIVSEYDPVSAEGIERLRVEFGPRLPPGRTWTLFNKLLPEFATDMGDFLKVAGFLPPMPWDVDVIRAFAQRGLAIGTKKGNTYTLGIMAVAKSLRPFALGEAIDAWKEKKAGVLREPIATELSTLDSEIGELERASITISYKLEQQQRKQSLQTTAIAISGLFVVLLAGLIPILFKFTKVTVWSYLGVGLTAAVGTGALTTALYVIRRSRESPIELAATKRSLERQIKDRAEERARYQALMIADTDELLSGRRPRDQPGRKVYCN